MGAFFYLLLLILKVRNINTENQPSCYSKVYCQGPLIDYVARNDLFNDSKTFVDLKIRLSPQQVVEDFNILLNITHGNPSKSTLKQFVDSHFEEEDALENWTPPDVVKHPKFLDNIDDVSIRTFAEEIVAIWPNLTRRIKPKVTKNPQQYSLIPLPNGFVVPGGRFKEIYYWDTYWVIKGLLLSEMTTTVKGILENFVTLVEKFGFIPNGNRIYYLNRSQPPLLTTMVEAYFNKTNDVTFLRKNVATIDKELQYWLNNKTVTFTKNGKTYTLAHYDSESGTPRPESYSEDLKTCSIYTADGQVNCYKDLKSAAESGWDFSSRWFFEADGSSSDNISNIQTRRVAGVDINSFLAQDFRILSSFYQILGNTEKSQYWRQKYETWVVSIDDIFYDKVDGIWYDYDLELKQVRKYFYPSNFAPLWAQAVNLTNIENLGALATKYFQTNIDFPAGIPTSLQVNSTQQWDYPEAWPPLQNIVIFGLENSGSSEARDVAKKYAEKWVKSLKLGYDKSQAMFEKYNALIPGKRGGGGEYTVQNGFGWTNGGVLELINHFYGKP